MSNRHAAGHGGRFARLNLLWLGLAVAVLYWLLESVVHFYFYQAEHGHSPLQAMTAMNDMNELMMRLLIVALLAGSGFAAERMRQNERRFRLREEKINRLLLFLREIFHHSQGFKDVQGLFEAACESAVGTGGARFAWIGLKKEGVLELSAWSTPDDVMREEVVKLKRPVDLECCKVTLAVLNGGNPVQCEVEERYDCAAPWVKVFLARGCSQAIALPLSVDRNVVGMFEIFAGEDGVFEKEEIAILQEAASDISVALTDMEHERKRAQTEKDMRRHIDELERFQRATVQREFRIRELREEVRLLQAKREVGQDGSNEP